MVVGSWETGKKRLLVSIRRASYRAARETYRDLVAPWVRTSVLGHVSSPFRCPRSPDKPGPSQPQLPGPGAPRGFDDESTAHSSRRALERV